MAIGLNLSNNVYQTNIFHRIIANFQKYDAYSKLPRIFSNNNLQIKQQTYKWFGLHWHLPTQSLPKYK